MNRIVPSVFAFALTVSAAAAAQPAKPTPRAVHCDHRLVGESSALPCEPTGPVALMRGQLLRVVVDNTQPLCFDFSVEVRNTEPPPEGKADEPCPTQSVTLDLVHNRKDDGVYVVTAKAKNDPTRECTCSLIPGQFEVPFETKRWDVAFAGAFTWSGQQDPVYALSPTTRTIDDPDPGAPPGATIEEPGFAIVRDRAKEDSGRIGLAAMVHLNWTPWSSGVVGWSPMSFGLGINEGANPTYALGTSLSFQEKAYLTLGYSLSNIDSLPPSLFPNQFIPPADQASTQAALASPTDRLSGAVFVAVSYQFGATSAKNVLSAAFPVTPTGAVASPPKPADDNSKDPDEEPPSDVAAPPTAEEKPPAEKADEEVPDEGKSGERPKEPASVSALPGTTAVLRADSTSRAGLRFETEYGVTPPDLEPIAVSAESARLETSASVLRTAPESTALFPPLEQHFESIERTMLDIFLIKGGNETTVQKWPFVVALLRKGKAPSGKVEWVHFCAGTVVQPQWVLTAAHCRPSAGDIVLLGRTDLRKPGGEAAAVQAVVRPGPFDPITYKNDISLLKLAGRGFERSPRIEFTTASVAGEPAYVLGWGRAGPGLGATMKLKEAEIPLCDREGCVQTYASRSRRVLATMLCAGGESNDTCKGDSGGPLVVYRDGQPRQAGITSFGRGACGGGLCGVYTSTASYSGWISSVTKGH